MWEKIGSASGIIIGAVALFIAFTLILFILERRTEKQPARKTKKPPIYVVAPGRRDRAA